MKKLKWTLLAFFSAVSLAASAQNPICPTGTFIPDPSARVVGNTMYIYGSLDLTADRYCSDRYHVLSSENARDWTLHSDAFRWKETLYAPDMAQKGDTYYLYFDTPDGSEFVARGDSPTGPFTGAVKIKGPAQIDPCVFIDDDGQAYFYWGQFSAKGAKLNPDMKTLDRTSIKDGIVTEEKHNFHEGSFVFKRGKYYYFVYADIGRKGRPTCLGYSMSESPLGPYEYKGVIIDNAGCDPGVWNNHGSVVRLGEQWYVLYHRSTNACEFMRRACIEPIFFNEDGTIDEVEMTSQGAGEALDAFAGIEAERACLLSGNCRIRMMEDSSDNEEIAEIGNGDTAVWKYLDFGESGAGSICLEMRAPASCTVSIYAGAELLGTVNVPESDGWTSVEAPVRHIGGIHPLTLKFSCTSPCEIDRLVFRHSLFNSGRNDKSSATKPQPRT